MAVTYGSTPSSSISRSSNHGKTEFDVLKENMRFIREGENPKNISWEDRLARAYESKLFKEFALIDLKHYKTKRIALRWRTAEEVVNAVGEDTCGSMRCAYHSPLSDHLLDQGAQMPPLQAFELPFTYAEAGETKTALVKVKVCHRCAKKLLFKPDEDEITKDRYNRDSSRDVSQEKDSARRRRDGSRSHERDRSTRRRSSKSPKRKAPRSPSDHRSSKDDRT